MSIRPWTREEVLLAINLYCKVPYARLNQIYPEVKELAKLLGRSPSAISMRCCNYASLDPVESKRVKGLSHVSKGDIAIWKEVNQDWEKFTDESERLLEQYKQKTLANTTPIPQPQASNCDQTAFPAGRKQERTVRVRIGQQFFRQTILTAYEHRCCISGLTHTALLIASHIKPWRVSAPDKECTNPHNGLCLSALYDKAFDAGLMTLDEKLRIIFSNEIRSCTTHDLYRRFFTPYEGKPLSYPPIRFSPSQVFLAYHREHVFEHQVTDGISEEALGT